MKILIYLFIISLLGIHSVLPTWNGRTSPLDLLGEENEYEYKIDRRNYWYGSSDELTKTIKKVDGKITFENRFKMYEENWNNEKCNSVVEFESMESIYGNTNSKTHAPIVCPKGHYNPIIINEDKTITELPLFSSGWRKNEKYDLKCFFHRSQGGVFLAYYLMNGNNYLLELKDTTFNEANKYRMNFEEIFDFKLLNRKDFVVAETNPYSFIGLVKNESNLVLIGAGIDFTKDSQSIYRSKVLLPIKKYTQAYFHVYHYNNNFYYFTYNDIHDFTSGYSTKSIVTSSNEDTDYSQIDNLTFVNNEKSPFEFQNDVEIIQMENIYNYRYVYYTIKDKVTNIIYHGLLDIILNKIVFNTDDEVDLFIPYITFITTEKEGVGYEHSNSMLMITKNSAYRVCAIKNGDDCSDECPSDKKLILDEDGNKCVDVNANCGSGKLILLPEEICVSSCNTSIFTSNGTHCGLCRDIESNKKYKFINGINCLEAIPNEGAILYNKNLSLLVCDKGYILQDDKCITHCFNTCVTCFDFSENENEQKCKVCIDGYYLENNITYNCRPIIPTTILLVPTTIPYVPTTLANIPTTIPYVPTTILYVPTTIPYIPTTLPIIPSTIEERPYNICTYQYYITYNCSFENLDNSQILEKLKREMLRTYPNNGITVEIAALEGYAFQLSNSLSQLASRDSAFSKIDLGECERNIKEHYGLAPDISLIFFKFENIGDPNNERKIQYQVYNPFNYDELNISICENRKIQLILSYELSELSDSLKKIIQNILDQGYDPFDENGKFYREICTPYNSENGTDVLLDGREEYYYSSIKSEMKCPSGCEMKSYSLDDKYINCECETNGTGIIELDYNNLNIKNIEDSFMSTFKNSNYKVMICYNLVFNFKIFCHNYGSIITLILFIAYVVFMVYYAFRNIAPLKVSISKLLFEEKKKNEMNSNLMNPYLLQIKAKPEKDTKSMGHNNPKADKDTKSMGNKNSKNLKESYPPKKNISSIRKVKGKNNNKKINRNQVTLIDVDNNKKPNIKNINQKEEINNQKRGKSPECMSEMYLKTKDKFIETKSQKNNDDKKNKVKFKIDDNDKATQIIYDDFELNNMGYEDAYNNDKRSCIRTYWSMIKREHYVIFTFISRNDHNLFYVKIERFFILICTEITMNGMFFVHETMHKKQNGGLTFAQKLPQIIFSLLVSHVVEVILCYLSMTDVAFYEIKSLPQKEKNYDNIFSILDCMKRKLVGFFVFTFLFFLFHWYFISAFCAVYQNTQVIYLRDSAISILISLIDPFIIYGIICLLRILSLSKMWRKTLCCVYKLSEVLPLF